MNDTKVCRLGKKLVSEKLESKNCVIGVFARLLWLDTLDVYIYIAVELVLKLSLVQ